jgi:DNA invertase Pin-like site-specific DNA recombinase
MRRRSRAKADRSELHELAHALDRDDVLIVTRLDRLARSTRDLLNILDQVAKAAAGFKSLKDTWADKTTPHGRLLLTLLGGLVKVERELIRARAGEGRKRAIERGVKFGGPRKLTPHQRGEALAASRGWRDAGRYCTQLCGRFDYDRSPATSHVTCTSD